MAFDPLIADRIRNTLEEKAIQFSEKKMMGGLCILVDDKMLCGIHFDKKKQMDLLMARIGPDVYESALEREYCHPMDFTGRPMNGYVFIEGKGIDTDDQLSFWIQLCLDFNPLAKSSKKKKK